MGTPDRFYTYGPGQPVLLHQPLQDIHDLLPTDAGANLDGQTLTRKVIHYPQPPSEAAMDIHDPDVQAMLHRYTGYRERREPLPSMAYFCLTMIEYRFHSNQRPKASRRFRIDLDVLNKIGHLTADKGGLDARKARKQKGVPENLTPHERAFLEQAVRKMILQAARVAASPEADIPTITMADLPPLPDK